MTKCLLLVLMLAPALMAQRPETIRFSESLKQFIGLTDEQFDAINRLNSSLRTFQSGKARRSGQVRLEISQETLKTQIDPMALGLRYLELEAIRRESQAEQERTIAEIQKLLTPPQTIKLEMLRQASRLQGVICEAQAINLLGVQQSGLIPDARIDGEASTQFFAGGCLSSGTFIRAPFPGGLNSADTR